MHIKLLPFLYVLSCSAVLLTHVYIYPYLIFGQQELALVLLLLLLSSAFSLWDFAVVALLGRFTQILVYCFIFLINPTCMLLYFQCTASINCVPVSLLQA